MKITKSKLKEIISEEIQKFIKTTKEELLIEDKITPEHLKNLLKQLEQENGD